MAESSDSKTDKPVTQTPVLLPSSHWASLKDETANHEYDTDDSSSERTSFLSSTTSVTSTLRRFRSLHGRTYHSEIGIAQSWTPNDMKHIGALEFMHASCLVAMDEKLFLAPVDTSKLKRVLDVGTGAGHWAIDMGDLYPNAEIIGLDITPMQPTWVPPNVSFQIDDANQPWTFADNYFDFVHTRFLSGCIADWDKFYRDAFRCIKPGGWLEHQEVNIAWFDDSDPIPEESPLGQYGPSFREAGNRSGRTFCVVADDLQEKGMKAAGFVDIHVKDMKIPFGAWPEDERQKELGILSKAFTMADLDGWLLFTFNEILGWKPEETQAYIALLRKELNNPKRNLYYVRRVVYGRKPEAS